MNYTLINEMESGDVPVSNHMAISNVALLFVLLSVFATLIYCIFENSKKREQDWQEAWERELKTQNEKK